MSFLAKNQKLSLFLLTLVVVNFFIRVRQVSTVNFGGDVKRDWLLIQRQVQAGRLPVKGPPASVNDSFSLGPGYYYLLYLLFVAANGQFQTMILLFNGLYSLSIILFFLATKQFFSQKAALAASAAYSLSPYFNSLVFAWNPYLLPWGILITLWLFGSLLKRKEPSSYFAWLLLSLGLLTHFHATAIFLIPVIGFYLLSKVAIKKISVISLISGLIVFLLSVFPYFGQISEIRSVFIPKQANIEKCVFTEWLQHHGHGERCFHYFRNTLFVGRFFSEAWFGTRKLIIAILSLVLIGSFLFFYKGKHYKLFWLWLGIPWGLFMLYSNNVYLHYFLIFFPLPFWMLGITIEKFHDLYKNHK